MRKKNSKRFIPNFIIAKDSLDISKLSRNKWAETVFAAGMDLTEADSEFFARESDPIKLAAT